MCWNKDSLTKLYYSYIHCSLNYANMEWGSTHKIKLHKVHLKQKHAVRLICNESKFTHTKPLMGSIQALNVFQVNIQKIMFMCSCIFLSKTCSDVPSIFAKKITYPSHRYPANSSKNHFALTKYLSHKSKYKIRIRSPLFRNQVLLNTEKELQEISLFKAILKLKHL